MVAENAGTLLRVCMAALVLGACGAGCAPRTKTFGFAEDESEARAVDRAYAAYRHPGRSTVQGRAVARTETGPMPVVQSEVRLTPITRWTREYVEDAQASGNWGDGVLSDDRAVVWMARTDDAGAFSFSQVPAGSYYVLCLARWEASTGEARQKMLVQRVVVGEEEVRAVEPFESH